MMVFLGQILDTPAANTGDENPPHVHVKRLERPREGEDVETEEDTSKETEINAALDELKHWRLYHSS